MKAILLLSVVLLFFAAYQVQLAIDERFGEYRVVESVLYFQNGIALRKVMFGLDNLAADLYWLRTVQYYGSTRVFNPGVRFDLMESLLHITTDLDPKLKIAYTYGSVFLSEPFPIGAGVPASGIKLIDKGIENNPDDWRLYMNKAFIYYWHLRDYAAASEVFLAGSKLPDAPEVMANLAGRSLTLGGDRATARSLWTLLLESSETETGRGNAIIHLQYLDALDHLDILNDMIRAYIDKSGNVPSSWQDLIAAGQLKGVPHDPGGTPYVLDREAESAALSVDSGLYGLALAGR